MRMVGLALLFAVLLISRDPHVLTQAELWGDDGWSWYPDAYNHGLASLLTPVGGYLNSLQRVGGLLGQLVPLRWVPTLFVVFALGVQIVPPLFIVSPRMGDVAPSMAYRLLMAFVYVMLPYTIEAHANLTNAQWHLAALAFLVLVARPPTTARARCFDLAVLALCGLSGPFCLMLLPLAVLRLWHERLRDNFWKAAVLLTTVLVQAAEYLSSPAGARSAAPLGAGPRMLARIVATQVLLGAELGYKTISTLPQAAFWHGNVLPLCICAVALSLAAIALFRGGWALRGLCLFAGLVLAAALTKPQASTIQAQWPLLAIPPIGNRYFMMPMLAWMGVVFTLAADRSRTLRGIGIVLLAVAMGWGIPHGWSYMDFPRPDFVSAARAFETAPVGTAMSFPQLPPGTSPMWLIKR